MRSSPNNRLNAIMEALLAAHDDAQRLSRSSLHRMPEFFIATRVADHFAEHFDNFGYRLEAQVKRTFEASDMQVDDITELLREPDLRLDMALHTADLDELDVNLVASEPLGPYLNHDHLPMANRAFQIVILEIQE